MSRSYFRKRCTGYNCKREHLAHAESQPIGTNPRSRFVLVGGLRPYLNARGEHGDALYHLSGAALRKLGLAIVHATAPRRKKTSNV